MEPITIILSSLMALFGGLNIFQFVFFRSTKKEYQARAEQAALDAKDARFESLQNQIRNMEELYRQQSDTLAQVRKELLDKATKEIESEKRVAQLEAENKSLSEKVARLEKELEAYRIINSK